MKSISLSRMSFWPLGIAAVVLLASAGSAAAGRLSSRSADHAVVKRGAHHRLAHVRHAAESRGHANRASDDPAGDDRGADSAAQTSRGADDPAGDDRGVGSATQTSSGSDDPAGDDRGVDSAAPTSRGSDDPAGDDRGGESGGHG